MFTAAVNAQTETAPKPQTEPVQPIAAEKPGSIDKYNNWSTDTYKMQPMPEALTTEKIFPVIGKYQITDKEGVASSVSVMLDPSNKGIVWIEGLPQGKMKATLRKSPATYKIPAQPLGEIAVVADVEANAAKELPEGVLIYDKDANVLNVCIGCKYNNEDPATAFSAAETVVANDMEKAAKTSKKSKVKIAKIKPVQYTGTKVIETTASAAQVQQ
jgi:hypothetical protein